jgi:hypothetical protein
LGKNKNARPGISTKINSFASAAPASRLIAQAIGIRRKNASYSCSANPHQKGTRNIFRRSNGFGDPLTGNDTRSHATAQLWIKSNRE